MSSAVAPGRQKSHTPVAPKPAASPLPAPAAVPAERPYWGDRLVLVFWLSCAGLLAVLHVGQHVVYLLR